MFITYQPYFSLQHLIHSWFKQFVDLSSKHTLPIQGSLHREGLNMLHTKQHMQVHLVFQTLWTTHAFEENDQIHPKNQ